MIRFAVPPIGGAHWLGGWNYMLNMVRSLAEHGPDDLETVLFLGSDVEPAATGTIAALPRTRVVHHPHFNASGKSSRLARALSTGVDTQALALFREHDISVALEPATFFGWRFPIPAFAWIPDFQHRRLPHLFSRLGWLRREAGFRAQLASGRPIMLSSADAEADCVGFYPSSKGRTHVARFAVSMDAPPDPDAARLIADKAGAPRRFFYLPNQLWGHKNHRLAVAAVAELKRAGTAETIIATGSGVDPRDPGYADRLRSEIATQGLADEFRMLGTVDYATVKALMLSATALINPSRFEGWSSTVEEARSVGTPMLLSDIGVHREQAADTARFFAPDSPDELAAAMRSCNDRQPDHIRAEMELASADTKRRTRQFALAVDAIIRKTMNDA